MAIKEIPDGVVEKFILGELPDRRLKELERELKNNKSLREKIEKIKTSNKVILSQYPVEKIVPGINNRLARENALKEYPASGWIAGYKKWLITAPAVVTALVLVFLFLPVFKSSIEHSTPFDLVDTTRVKGDNSKAATGPHLLIFCKRENGAELLKGETIVRAGDLLQIAYVAKNDSYGIILSIDGNGIVTLHYPENKNTVPVLQKLQKVLLKNSYELDNAPGFERFFFISSNDKLEVESVIKEAEKLAKMGECARGQRLELPDSINQYSMLFNKVKNNDK